MNNSRFLKLVCALALWMLTGCGPLGTAGKYLGVVAKDDSELIIHSVRVVSVDAGNTSAEKNSAFGMHVSYRVKEDQGAGYSWKRELEQQTARMENFRLEKIELNGNVEVIPFSGVDASDEYHDGRKLGTALYLGALIALAPGSYRFSVREIMAEDKRIGAQEILFSWPPANTAEGVIYHDDELHY